MGRGGAGIIKWWFRDWKQCGIGRKCWKCMHWSKSQESNHKHDIHSNTGELFLLNFFLENLHFLTPFHWSAKKKYFLDKHKTYLVANSWKMLKNITQMIYARHLYSNWVQVVMTLTHLIRTEPVFKKMFRLVGLPYLFESSLFIVRGRNANFTCHQGEKDINIAFIWVLQIRIKKV